MEGKFIITKDINAADKLKKQGFNLLNENNGTFIFENKDSIRAEFSGVDAALYTFTDRMFL